MTPFEGHGHPRTECVLTHDQGSTSSEPNIVPWELDVLRAAPVE